MKWLHNKPRDTVAQSAPVANIPIEPDFDLSIECQYEIECHFRSNNQGSMKLHHMKHESGQQQMELLTEVHERHVKSKMMTPDNAVACKMADRYYHLTIGMQDQEITMLFLRDVFEGLSSQQKGVFTLYLASRLSATGNQLDMLALQCQQDILRRNRLKQ